MAVIQSCPDASAWKGLLAGIVPPEDERLLQQHLDVCPLCQKELEQCSGATTFVGQLAVKLQRTHSEVPLELANVLDTAKEGEVGEPTIAEPGQTAIDPLVLLEPSDLPDVLGRLDQFEVLSVLGQGGMGVVFQAQDVKLRRLVAIKVLSPYLSPDRIAQQRFLREARAAAAINHPHAVTIYGVHDPNDAVAGAKAYRHPYLVMELVEGHSLQRLVSRGRTVPLKEALRIATDVAEALTEFHARGLVHRDLKPANILIEARTGRAKITDFGLARGADDPTLTKTGIVAGTPAFMSPEQALGEPIDHRSDLFSLGSVLYTMLAGFPPYRGSTTLQTMMSLQAGPPPSLSTLRGDLPAALVRLIDRLHARSPADRPHSAADVVTELRRLRGSRSKSGQSVAISESADDPTQLVEPTQLIEPTAILETSRVVPRHKTERQNNSATEFLRSSRGIALLATMTFFAVPLLVWSLMSDGTTRTRPSQQVDRSAPTESTPAVSATVAEHEPPAFDREQPLAAQPFVILDEAGRELARCGSFDEAKTAIQDRDNVVLKISDNGPFVIKPWRVDTTRLKIVAAEGFVPVLIAESNTADAAALLIEANATLELDGLEFRTAQQPQAAAARPLIVSRGTSLQVTRCRFRADITSSTAVLRSDSPINRIDHCEFYSADGFAVMWESSDQGEVVLEDSIVAGRGGVLIESASPPPPTRLELIRNTLVNHSVVQIQFSGRDERPLQFSQTTCIARDNVIFAEQSLLSASWTKRRLPQTVDFILTHMIRWRDQNSSSFGNAIEIESGYWIWKQLLGDRWSATDSSPRDSVEWKRTWGLESPFTRPVDAIQLHRGDLSPSTARSTTDFQAADFRFNVSALRLGRSDPPGAITTHVGPGR